VEKYKEPLIKKRGLIGHGGGRREKMDYLRELIFRGEPLPVHNLNKRYRLNAEGACLGKEGGRQASRAYACWESFGGFFDWGFFGRLFRKKKTRKDLP